MKSLEVVVFESQNARMHSPKMTVQDSQDMCQGLNSHYFHIIGDAYQPNSRGLYTHYYKDSYEKVG